MIAGFDMEAGRVAADGTTYNNGYGICLIPVVQLTNAPWYNSNTSNIPYKISYIHNTILPDIVTKLQNVLGSHIVNRNVLLSSSANNEGSTAYTWTTAYATLMSVGQMTGTFAANKNKYDDGEANYKLPIFNFKEFKNNSSFWSRGVSGFLNTYRVWYVNPDGGIVSDQLNRSYGVRPLIYIR